MKYLNRTAATLQAECNPTTNLPQIWLKVLDVVAVAAWIPKSVMLLPSHVFNRAERSTNLHWQQQRKRQQSAEAKAAAAATATAIAQHKRWGVVVSDSHSHKANDCQQTTGDGRRTTDGRWWEESGRVRVKMWTKGIRYVCLTARRLVSVCPREPRACACSAQRARSSSHRSRASRAACVCDGALVVGIVFVALFAARVMHTHSVCVWIWIRSSLVCVHTYTRTCAHLTDLKREFGRQLRSWTLLHQIF